MPFPRPRKTDSEDVLYEYAVGALARRMRSVAELKRLLRPRVEAETEYGKTLVELVIRRLERPGLSERRQICGCIFVVPPRQRKIWTPPRDHRPESQRGPRRSDRQGGGFGLRRSQRRETGPRLSPPQALAEAEEPERCSPNLPPAGARRVSEPRRFSPS